MKKLFTILFIFISLSCYSDITIHKIKSKKPEHGQITVGVVLDDGSSKRLAYRGNLTNVESEQIATIISEGQELFDSGRDWAPHHLDSELASRLPDVANINASNSVPELRAQVALLLGAVETIREMVE